MIDLVPEQLLRQLLKDIHDRVLGGFGLAEVFQTDTIKQIEIALIELSYDAKIGRTFIRGDERLIIGLFGRMAIG